MRDILGITGTPGTGKKSVANELSGMLGCTSKDLNALAREFGCSENVGDSEVVDTNRLRRSLRGRDWGRVVFHGHLLPEIFRGEEIDSVAVLRCEPTILKRRLQARGYLGGHLRDNLEAELIGVSLSASLRSFGAARVAEFDTSSADPKDIAAAIVTWHKARRGSRRGGKREWVDWTTRYESAAELTSLLLSSSSRTESAFT